MRLSLLIGSMLLAAGFSVQADVLEMPSASSTFAVNKPTKGATMAAVQQQFGTPVKKYPAVGGGSRHQPPITRWDYAGFSVFFENDHVVDSVVPGQPPPLQRSEELQSSLR